MTDEELQILKTNYENKITKLNNDIETLNNQVKNLNKDIEEKDKQIEIEQKKAFEYWKQIPVEAPKKEEQNQLNKSETINSLLDKLIFN